MVQGNIVYLVKRVLDYWLGRAQIVVKDTGSGSLFVNCNDTVVTAAVLFKYFF